MPQVAVIQLAHFEIIRHGLKAKESSVWKMASIIKRSHPNVCADVVDDFWLQRRQFGWKNRVPSREKFFERANIASIVTRVNLEFHPMPPSHGETKNPGSIKAGPPAQCQGRLQSCVVK